MALYVKADGVEGDVTTQGFENQFEIDNFHFEMARAIHMQVGNLNNMSHGRPSFGKLTFTKRQSTASPTLMTQFFLGKSIANLTVSACHTDKNLTPQRQYIFKDLMVSYVGVHETNASSNNKEIYRLSYSSMEVRDTLHDKENAPQTPKSSGYDLENAASI